jgi:hypothetical protein
LIAAAMKRIHTNVRKLAMVYAATEKTLPIISQDQLRAAIAVGKYTAECMKVLIEQRGTNRPEAELEKHFLTWVGKFEGHKKRYMQQCLSKKAGSCEIFNKVFVSLERAGHVEVREGKVYRAQ